MDTPTKFAEEIASEFDDDSEFRKSKGYFCTPKQGATLLVKGGGLDLSKTADLGAGVGMLTAALVESVASGTKNRHIHCTLYENEVRLIPLLRKVMRHTQRWAKTKGVNFRYSVRKVDLLEAFRNEKHAYTTIVSNPPFLRVPADSELKKKTRKFLCTVNLYGSFMEGTLNWTAKGGHFLLITPTSWKNGSHFELLRKELLREAKLRRVVSFTRRDVVFDDVLQEVEFTKWKKKGVVRKNSKIEVGVARKISKVKPETEFSLGYSKLIPDIDKGIILTIDHERHLEMIESVNGGLPCTLEELGLNIRIGEVVMFREDEGAVQQGDKRSGDIPLIREHHINPWGLKHPGTGDLEEWISSKSPRVKTIGEFVVISRRGAKGDRRILTACYVPELHCGIENKVVYLRSEDSGKKSLMKGVSAFLNTMFAELQIRTITGGTMVNKSDLERLKIPSEEVLTSIGEKMDPDPEDSRELQELVSEQLGLSNSDKEEWIEHSTRWRGNR